MAHSVAGHLGISLAEYDARIRSFIPWYDEMLDAAAGALAGSERRIVDLGTGTGALSERCLAAAPRAHLTAIDADADIVASAQRRLGRRAEFLIGSFLRVPIPPADAIVASLSLHHVRTRAAKRTLYSRVRAALRRGGRFVLADCCPAARAAAWHQQRAAWLVHLQRRYSRRDAEGLLQSWAREDVYVPLASEVDLMARARLRPEVVWRRGPFAVIVGYR